MKIKLTDPAMRYDAFSTRKYEKTPEGFLRVPATLSRVGVLTYRNADGSTRRELRLADEVFKEDSLRSFAMLPVTDNHPPVPVTANNARDYQRGAVSETVRQDGDFLVGTLMVTDAALVGAIERGEKREVSCGYHCDLEWKAGEYNGQKYDCIQRNIRGNHVAMVARGRAGPEVRVRLDSADAIMVTDSTEEAPMFKYRIDGVEYEVPEQAAQAFEKVVKQHNDALDAARASQTSATAEKDKAVARADAAEKKVKDLEAQLTPEAFSKRVQERSTLEQRAKLIAKDFKTDGLTDEQVVSGALKAALKDLDQTGKSSDYLRARFDTAVEEVEATQKKTGQVNLALGAARGANATNLDAEDPKAVAEKARQEMIKRNREAASQPLATSTQKSA